MSKFYGYDIYGEPLERGYCEVHPWIPEEYPCYMCKQQQEQDRQNREAEKLYYEQLEKEYLESLVKNVDGDGI